MNTNWESLANCLRAEVEEYGSLLRLLEEQQHGLIRRDADRLQELATAVDAAAQSADLVRRRREDAFRAFAVAAGCDAHATVRAILPCIEASARPLIEALVQEVNRLVYLTRKFARQNHEMLGRACQLQQDLLRQVCPGIFSQTYAATGRISPGGVATSPVPLAAC
jgi:flagellar biosynthesis/type III secretory pathway chaperone